MQIKAKVVCEEGSARVMFADTRENGIIHKGDDMEVMVAETDKLSDNPTRAQIRSFMRANYAVAWCPIAVGSSGESGTVSITPVDVPLIVRKFNHVNAFMNPEAEDYRDYLVPIGKKLVATTIESNVITMMVRSLGVSIDTV